MNERVDADQILEKLVGSEDEIALRQQREEEEEDERLAKAVFKDVDGDSVKRLRDDEFGDDMEPNAAQIAMAKFSSPLSLPDFSQPLMKKRKQGISLGLTAKKPSIVAAVKSTATSTAPLALLVSKTSGTTAPASSSSAASASEKKPSSLLALVGSYGSDSDSD